MASAAPEPHRPTFVVDPRAQPRASLARIALAPASLVVCAGLFYALHWPMAGVVAVALLELLASIWLGPFLDRARTRLDRDMVALLSAKKPEALLTRVEGATFFRLLGAPGEVAEREGRALRAVGDKKRALAAYRRAIDGYDHGRAPLSLIAGLGHAAYEAEDDTLAEAALSAAHQSSGGLPEVSVRLAHLRHRRGAPFELSEAETSETARLVRALLALSAGEVALARAALKDIAEDDSASWARARADLVEAFAAERAGKRRKH